MTEDNEPPVNPPADIASFRLIKNLEREVAGLNEQRKPEDNKVAAHFERLAQAAREGKIVEFVAVTTGPGQAVELSFECASDGWAKHRMAVNLRLAEQMIVNSIVGSAKL